MTVSSAVHAFGTLLQRGDSGSPETFTTIAEVVTLPMPSLTLETIDVTNHSSTGGWREFIGGLKDGGEFSCDLNYLPTNSTQNYSTGLLGDLAAKTKRNYKIVMSDGSSTTWTFSALVTSFEPAAEIDDRLMVSVTFKLSGQPTLA